MYRYILEVSFFWISPTDMVGGTPSEGTRQIQVETEGPQDALRIGLDRAIIDVAKYVNDWDGYYGPPVVMGIRLVRDK